MPTDSKTAEIVARLRANTYRLYSVNADGHFVEQRVLPDCAEAADLLEANAQKIERLEKRCAYYEADAAAAWDKCEERRKEAEAAEARASALVTKRDNLRRALSALVLNIDAGGATIGAMADARAAIAASGAEQGGEDA